MSSTFGVTHILQLLAIFTVINLVIFVALLSKFIMHRKAASREAVVFQLWSCFSSWEEPHKLQEFELYLLSLSQFLGLMVTVLCDLKSTGVGGKLFSVRIASVAEKKDLCPTTSEDLLKISAPLNIFAVTIIFEKRICNNNDNNKKILFSAAP